MDRPEVEDDDVGTESRGCGIGVRRGLFGVYWIATPPYECTYRCSKGSLALDKLNARPAIFGNQDPNAEQPCRRACFISAYLKCDASMSEDALEDLPPNLGCPAGEESRDTCYPQTTKELGTETRVNLADGACDLEQTKTDCDAYITANAHTLLQTLELPTSTPPSFTTSYAWCWPRRAQASTADEERVAALPPVHGAHALQ